MRLFAFMLLASFLALSGSGSAQSLEQSQAGVFSPPATVAAVPGLGGFTYQVTNAVTYSKTATGLLVVLQPAALKGAGPLAGHTEGLTLEIPDAFIKQLFF